MTHPVMPDSVPAPIPASIPESIPAPCVILVDPQMGENIGASARAMCNCGLEDLRLVRPRDSWPNPKATAMAVGAFERMRPVRVYETTAEAIADLHYVCATTARPRDQAKPVYDARSFTKLCYARAQSNQKTGILFGGERAGLSNDDVSVAHSILTLPLNPDFCSLNLAQAVLLLAYEWRMQIVMDQDSSYKTAFDAPPHEPAPHGSIDALINRLEQTLSTHHFFRSPDLRPTMVRNIRTMLLRTHMSEQEIRTCHGIITALSGGKDPAQSRTSRKQSKNASLRATKLLS